MAVMIDLLAFEKISEKAGEATLKHPNSPWLLVLHEAGPDAPTKPMHNHWGVRVSTGRGRQRLRVSDSRTRLNTSSAPLASPRGAMARTRAISSSRAPTAGKSSATKISLARKRPRERFGGVKKAALGRRLSRRAISRPRLCAAGDSPTELWSATDLEANRKFYTEVLGLDVHRFSDHVIYVKHPRQRLSSFAHCARTSKVFSPNFRNTLTVESKDAVKTAYIGVRRAGKDLGVTELFPLQEDESAASFCFRDPGTNCWEIVSAH